MKIAYVFSANYWKKDGVSKKISSQISLWREMGHDVSGFCLTPYKYRNENPQPFDFKVIPFKKSRLNFVNNSDFLSRFMQSNGLSENLENLEPDVIYFRYETYKPFLKNLLSFPCKRVMEVNTIDVVENRTLAFNSVKNFAICIYSYFTRNKIFKRVDKLVTITDEIAKHESIAKFNLPHVAIPNPIDLSKVNTLKRKKDQRERKPKVLFLGSRNFPWFGVDLILKLAESVKDKLDFVLIGALGVDSPPTNVDVHNYLSGSELKEVVGTCDISMSSAALFRYGLNEAATLKVREYLAWGFPLILCHTDSAFKNQNPGPDWVLQIPNQETGLQENLEKIVDFCYKHRDTLVAEDEVKKYLDIEKLEAKRIDFLS